VTYLVMALIVVGFGYLMTSGRRSTPVIIPAVLIGAAAAAALAAYDGVTLAAREYARTHDGRLSPGVVIGKSSSSLVDSSPRARGRSLKRSGSLLITEGYRVHDVLGRLILTGSSSAWIIEYRYTCERAVGCPGRDFVRESLWRKLYNGDPINVRRANTEYGSSRLDENPQWGTAVVDIATAGVLLLVGGLVSGRLGARRRRYLTVPAVVTAIEPVTEGGSTRWRITFAYVDHHGMPQESVDRVATDHWKPGDDCLAVFPPGRPDLAGFQPPSTP
jgi:hypothetical protein